MTQDALPDMPPAPTAEEAELRGLLKRYSELTVQALDITREANAIKERFRKLGRGTHDLGVGKVIIAEQKKFNPELAEKVLRAIHPELVAKCSAPAKVDATLTKQFVSGEVYERCQKPAGEDKVTIS